MSELVTDLLFVIVLTYVGLFLIIFALGLAYFAWTNNLPGHRGIIVAWGVPAVIACLCCSAPITLPILKDNFWLYQLEQRLYNYPIPPESRVISRESTITPNTGNGNYCIFTIRQTMTTMLEQSEVSAYYANAEVLGVSKYPRPIWVKFGGITSNTSQLRFAIEINDMTERFFDIRCYSP